MKANTYALTSFLRNFILGVAAAAVLVTLLPQADAHAATFQSSCTNSGVFGYSKSSVTRTDAANYAYSGNKEGYQWGGGCWNNNDVDDSPNDPPQTYAGGEGGDCSGFTFKSWMLREDQNSTSPFYWYTMSNKHGPWTASNFKSGVGSAVTTYSKASVVYMDALASSSHIGMVRQANTAYNTDLIIEAKSEADGTGIWSRTYRGSSSYSGVRRVGWANG